MASQVEIILGARDESGPVLDQYGRNVRRTFEQTDSDARRAAQGTGVLDSALGGLGRTFLAVGAAFGIYRAGDFAKDAVMLAARYETLGATLANLGKNAGYATPYLEQQEAALRKSGITAIGARDSLAKMMQANLDLSKSSQLARVAQDAAAISGLNSTEAYQHLVYGIQSAQVEMLRTIGINVSFEQSYAAVAAQTGRTADSLSEAEKAQIRLNAVLDAGRGIAGSYEAAMGTAGKQILSFQRYVEDMQVELGKAFGPALSAFVANASSGMAGLTEGIKESAAGGVLHDLGDGLQWIAEHGTVATAALGGLVTVMAAAKAEAWLLEANFGRLALGLEATGKAALFTLRNAFTNYPLVTAAAGVSMLVAGLSLLMDHLGRTEEAMQRQAQAAAQASREYQRLADTVNDVGGPIRIYQEALARANGDERKQLEALKALGAVFPDLVGDYHSVAEGLANVSANLERFLNLKRAELAILKEKAEKEQSERLANLVSQYQDLADANQKAMTSVSASMSRNLAFARGELAQFDKDNAASLRALYVEASKVANTKGISPELRDSAEDLKGKAYELLNRIVGVKDALKMLGLEAERVVAPLQAVFTLPQLGKGDKEALKEIIKLGDEAKKAFMTPVQAKLFDIDQEVAKQTQALWQSNPSAEMAKAGEDAIAAWATAQRAALGPELAKTRTELVRGMYDLGQASREQVLANLRAEAAVYAAGGERTIQQYLATQRAITDLELQGLHDRQALVQANINLGQEGQGALVAAYQAELALLPVLKLSAEDRAKRELDLIAKIRDAERARVDVLQEIETQRVSWLDEGAAKERASLEESIQRERLALERKIADRKEYQEQEKQLRAEFERWADRQREKLASKEKQTDLDIATQAARLAGNTRLAKELELEKYVESLRASGYTQLQQEQLIANKRLEIHQTGLERLLLEQADFYEGWDKIGENALTGIQSDLVNVFREARQDITTIWSGLFGTLENIADQAFAAILARLATYGLSNLVLALFPSLSPALGPLAGQQGGAGSLLSMASTAKGLWDAGGLLSGASTGGIGGWLVSKFGTSGDVLGVGMGGAGENTLWGMSAGQLNAMLGAAGIGALGGQLITPMIYGGKGYSTMGGTVGAAAGAAAGMSSTAMAALGLSGGPWTAAALGLAGLLAGGGLGSLFGEDEDKRQAFEIPGNYKAHMDELSNRVRDYSKLLREGKISQAEFNEEAYKMAPLAAGAGDYLAGYGGIIGGTLDKLKGLTYGTEEYAHIVSEELNPAWVISKGLADDLANGMSELDARKRALSNSIDALAASSKLSADQQDQLVNLIINQSGSVADLTAKYERYNEIKQQLMNAYQMEPAQVAALGDELRSLHDELGIQEEPMTAVVNTMGDLNVSMKEMVATLKEMAGLPKDYTFNVAYNQTSTGLTNPGTAHGGKLITRHGGGDVPFYAHAGYNPAWPAPRPGEVDIRALVGEWVIQPAAVDYYGNDFMAAINAMRVPVVRASTAAAQVASPSSSNSQSDWSTGEPLVAFNNCHFGSDPQQTAQAVGQIVEAKLKELSRVGRDLSVRRTSSVLV